MSYEAPSENHIHGAKSMVMQGLASHGPASAAQQELSRVMKGAQSFLSRSSQPGATAGSLTNAAVTATTRHSCNSQGSQLRNTQSWQDPLQLELKLQVKQQRRKDKLHQLEALSVKLGTLSHNKQVHLQTLQQPPAPSDHKTWHLLLSLTTAQCKFTFVMGLLVKCIRHSCYSIWQLMDMGATTVTNQHSKHC